MIFPPDFSWLGLFVCHVAWQNMGGKCFVWSLGTQIFWVNFLIQSCLTCQVRLPGQLGFHLEPRRLLGGPHVNFDFGFYG